LRDSIINTYKSLGAVLVEALDPKHWRTWPLDPKNPSKGTLSAQKTSSQQKPKARGGYWSSEQQRDFAPTSRVRVTTPADDLGIKGTQTHHTTSKGRVGHKPQLVKKRTSVKGKTKEGKQIKVSDFPTSHSAKKNESILNTYRSIGAILAEALTKRQKLGIGGALALGGLFGASQLGGEVKSPPPPATLTHSVGGPKAKPTPKLATPKARVTVKPKEMFTQAERFPRGSSKENLMQQYKRHLRWDKSEDEDDDARKAPRRSLKRKPRIEPWQDGFGKWHPGPKPDESKNESILNTYRSIGAVLAEARRGAPDDDSDKAAKASGKKATARQGGKVKTLTKFERDNLKSMGGEDLRDQTLKNLRDKLEDKT